MVRKFVRRFFQLVLFPVAFGITLSACNKSKQDKPASAPEKAADRYEGNVVRYSYSRYDNQVGYDTMYYDAVQHVFKLNADSFRYEPDIFTRDAFDRRGINFRFKKEASDSYIYNHKYDGYKAGIRVSFWSDSLTSEIYWDSDGQDSTAGTICIFKGKRVS